MIGKLYDFCQKTVPRPVACAQPSPISFVDRYTQADSDFRLMFYAGNAISSPAVNKKRTTGVFLIVTKA